MTEPHRAHELDAEDPGTDPHHPKDPEREPDATPEPQEPGTHPEPQEPPD